MLNSKETAKVFQKEMEILGAVKQSGGDVTSVIIAELLALLIGLEDKIFATNPDGTVALNNKGVPKISIWKVISNLSLIIGRVSAAIRYAKETNQ